MSGKAPLLAALAAALAFSACNSLDSPEAVTASAYTDVQKNDLTSFRETLAGAALAQYGTLEAMGHLRTELVGQQLMTGERRLLGVEKHSPRHYTYHYALEVLGRPSALTHYSRLKAALILCDWYRGHPGATDSEECHITDLN